jgi:hypothetical protein
MDPLDALAEEMNAFYDIRSDSVDVTGTRRDQDAVLRGEFQQKKEAFSELKAALLQMMADSDDTALQGRAKAALGDLNADFAGYIEGHPTPTYLTGAQAEQYETVLGDMAEVHWDQAARSYAEALEHLPTNFQERERVQQALETLPPEAP